MKRVNMHLKLALSTTCTTWRSFHSGARAQHFCIVAALELAHQASSPTWRRLLMVSRPSSTQETAADPPIPRRGNLEGVNFSQLPIYCFTSTNTQHHALPTSKAWKGRCPACHASSFVVGSGSVACYKPVNTHVECTP